MEKSYYIPYPDNPTSGPEATDSLEKVLTIERHTEVPSGWHKLKVGEIRKDGDMYLDIAFFAGHWMPVKTHIGVPVKALGAIVIRKNT